MQPKVKTFEYVVLSPVHLQPLLVHLKNDKSDPEITFNALKQLSPCLDDFMNTFTLPEVM